MMLKTSLQKNQQISFCQKGKAPLGVSLLGLALVAALHSSEPVMAQNATASSQAVSVQPKAPVVERPTAGKPKTKNPRVAAALARCNQIDAMLENVQNRKVASGAEAKAKRVIANLQKSAQLCATFRAKHAAQSNAQAGNLRPVAAANANRTNAGNRLTAANRGAAAGVSNAAVVEIKPLVPNSNSTANGVPTVTKATPGQIAVCNRLQAQYDRVSQQTQTPTTQKLLTGLASALQQCARLVQ